MREKTCGGIMKDRGLWRVMCLLSVLNVCDALATVAWTQLTITTEANPLLHHLVHNDPFGFILVKVTLVSLCQIILWSFRDAARTAIYVLCLAYVVLCCYHLHALFALLINTK